MHELRNPPWVPTTVLGYLQLYLALSLFVAFPLSYAAEGYKFIKLPGGASIQYAIPTVILTGALLLQIFKENYEDERENRVRFHLEYYLKKVRPDLEYKTNPEENLDNAWKGTNLAKPLNKEDANRLLITLFQAHSYLAKTQKDAQEREEALLADQQATDAINNDWYDIGKLFDEKNAEAPRYIRPLIEKTIRLADLTPFYKYFPLSKDSSNYESSTEIVEDINRLMRNYFEELWLCIPSWIRQEEDKQRNFGEQVRDSLKKLKKGIERASQQLKTPSKPEDVTMEDPLYIPPSPVATGMISVSDLAQYLDAKLGHSTEATDAMNPGNWQAIMDLRLNDKLSCTHPRELADALREPITLGWGGMLQKVRELRNTRMSVACTHVAELVQALELDIGVEWTAAINYMKDLINLRQAPNHSTPTNAATLFKVEEVPKFDGEKDEYWTWRSAFVLFSETTTVEPPLLKQALARIMTALSGKAQRIALAWNPAALVKGTWKETCEEIIKYTDTHFLEPMTHYKLHQAWEKMRYNNHNAGHQFVSDFITQVQLLNQIAVATRPAKREISHAEAMSVLLRKLPEGLRNRLQHNFGDIVQMETTSQEQCNLVASEWEFWLSENKVSPRAQTIPIAAPFPLPNKAPQSVQNQGTNYVKDRSCGLRCSYDSPNPAVPTEFRGRLYPSQNDDPTQVALITRRNQNCRNQNRCEACRRTQQEHPNGTVFKPVRPLQARLMPAAMPARPVPAPRPETPTNLLD